MYCMPVPAFSSAVPAAPLRRLSSFHPAAANACPAHRASARARPRGTFRPRPSLRVTPRFFMSFRPSPTDVRILAALSGQHVVVTGATGLIARALIPQLLSANASVTVLVRNPTQARSLFPTAQTVYYDAASPSALPAPVAKALSRASVVVNLAGEPIDSHRWTPARKRLLRASRITGTSNLAAHLRDTASTAVFVSVSAVGYYGTHPSTVFTEHSVSRADDFLSAVACDWENAVAEHPARTVILRLGVVLSRDGGALAKMEPVFRRFLGGVPGSGRQWLSWIHIHDVVRILIHAAADPRWHGVYNATAPQPVRLSQFGDALGRAMRRPSWIPVPSGVVQAVMGGEAAQLVLAGQHVMSERTPQLGFVYQYKDVNTALQQLLSQQAVDSPTSPHT